MSSSTLYARQYLTELNDSIIRDEKAYFGFFKEYLIFTAFQPVFSFAHRGIIGYEALLRVRDSSNCPVPPTSLFAGDLSSPSLKLLDRLCRCLHLKNFTLLNDSTNWLFLNISPQMISDGEHNSAFFQHLLETTGFPPHQTVIEIAEHPVSHEANLRQTIESYRQLGCLIAFDDYGNGHSNMERIWSLNPDIVKLDRSLLLQAAESGKIRRLLPQIVALLHQAESLVLLEGIETEEQARIALECDVDFVQGFRFAKPSVELNQIEADSFRFESLLENFLASAAEETFHFDHYARQCYGGFEKAVNDIRNGIQLPEACRELLQADAVVRCYQLHPSGRLIEQTAPSSRQGDPRFKPLQKNDTAERFRRHYLRNALQHPEQLQVTEPYLSVNGSHLCVTLSMMFETNAGQQVFCCDLNWD